MGLRWLLVVAALGAAGPAAAAPRTWAFVNGRWYDAGRFESRTVWVAGDTFASRPPARVDTTVDLEGRWVVPPFGEAHTHNLESEHELDARVRKYLADGVFYAKMQSSIRRRVAGLLPRYNRRDGIDVSFAHAPLTARDGHPVKLRRTFFRLGRYQGLFASEAEIEGHGYVLIDSLPDLERKWSGVLATRPDFIKTMLVCSEEFGRRRDDTTFAGRKGLDPRLLPAIVRRAHAAGLRVSVHVSTVTDFHHAVASGADEIAHLPALHGWCLGRIADADAREAARRGVVVVTTAGLARAEMERVPEAADTLRETLVANLATLVRHGVTLAVGSDAWDDDSVEEAAFLASTGVLSNAALLEAWSVHAPRTIFPGRRIGRLAPGHEASFLALDGDPVADFANVRRIALRFKQGAILAVP